MKIYIVYDSEGEHTKALADSLADGAQEGCSSVYRSCGTI
ncbi:hypothetical protein SRABI96_01032 [Peribacillus sp. Bi96]|nr:hypothetical protein SRABI96_01032 [Peribacillus sp. Bi96]